MAQRNDSTTVFDQTAQSTSQSPAPATDQPIIKVTSLSIAQKTYEEWLKEHGELRYRDGFEQFNLKLLQKIGKALNEDAPFIEIFGKKYETRELAKHLQEFFFTAEFNDQLLAWNPDLKTKLDSQDSKYQKESKNLLDNGQLDPQRNPVIQWNSLVQTVTSLVNYKPKQEEQDLALNLAIATEINNRLSEIESIHSPLRLLISQSAPQVASNQQFVSQLKTLNPDLGKSNDQANQTVLDGYLLQAKNELESLQAEFEKQYQKVNNYEKQVEENASEIQPLENDLSFTDTDQAVNVNLLKASALSSAQIEPVSTTGTYLPTNLADLVYLLATKIYLTQARGNTTQDQAITVVSFVLEKYKQAVDKLINFFKQQQQKLQTDFAEKLTKLAQETLGIATSSPADTDGGGEQAEDDSTKVAAFAENLPTELQQSFGIWLNISQTWSGLTNQQQEQVSFPDGPLTHFDLENSAALQAAFSRLLTEIEQEEESQKQQQLENLVRTLSTQANLFNQQLIELQQTVTSADLDDEEKPATPTTDSPATDASTVAQPAETPDRFANLYEVSKTKFKLIQAVQAQLEQELKNPEVLAQLGFTSEQELLAFLHELEPDISATLWKSLIEQGALADGKLSSVAFATLLNELTITYLDKIATLRTQSPIAFQALQARWQEQQSAQQRQQQFEQTEVVSEAADTLQLANLNLALAAANSFQISDLLSQLEAAKQAYITQLEQQGLSAAQLKDLADKADLSISGLQSLLQQIQQPGGNLELETVLKEISQYIARHPWLKQAVADPNSPINQLLFIAIFAQDDLMVAQALWANQQAQWQKIQNVTPSLSTNHQKVANVYSKLTTSSTNQDDPTAQNAKSISYEDQQSQNQFLVDDFFAQSLVLTSDLNKTQQDQAITLLAIYFVAGGQDKIALDQVLTMIQTIGQVEILEQAHPHSIDLESASSLNLDPAFIQQLQNDPALVQELLQQHHEQQIAYHQDLSTQYSKIGLMIGAAKIAGYAATGRWDLAAKEILTNKDVQKAALKYGKKIAGIYYLSQFLPYLIGAGLLTGLAGKLLNLAIKPAKWIFNAATDITKGLIGAAKSVAKEIFGSGSSAEAELIKQAVGAKSSGNAVFNKFVNAANQTAQTIGGGTTQAAGMAGAATKTFGVVLAASVVAPLVFVSLLTVIVITVIGGSLNDLPGTTFLGRGLLQAHGEAGCWPTTGKITQLPEAPFHKVTTTTDGRRGSAVDIGNGNNGPVPVYASFAGFAKYLPMGTSDNGGYGNYVILEANIGYTFYFAHLDSSNIPTSGKSVTAGEIIGLMGSTGNSTGKHLHYEVLHPTTTIPSIRSFLPEFVEDQSVSPNQCLENLGSMQDQVFVGGADQEATEKTEKPDPDDKIEFVPGQCSAINNLCYYDSDCCGLLVCKGITGIKTCQQNTTKLDCENGFVWDPILLRCEQEIQITPNQDFDSIPEG